MESGTNPKLLRFFLKGSSFGEKFKILYMSLIVYVWSVHTWVCVSSSNQSTGQFYNDELF